MIKILTFFLALCGHLWNACIFLPNHCRVVIRSTYIRARLIFPVRVFIANPHFFFLFGDLLVHSKISIALLVPVHFEAFIASPLTYKEMTAAFCSFFARTAALVYIALLL